MKEHHRVDVIRIEQVLPHTNADKLEIVPIQGYQAVVGKGQFKVGDLAYYIPPDSIVPDREEYAFLWGNATYEGGTPERKRRIGAKKLRGEWSEGVLMPVGENPFVGASEKQKQRVGRLNDPNKADVFHVVEVGQDVSDLLGITHYNPPEPGEGARLGGNEGKRRYPRSFAGWKQLILAWLRGERREGGISLPTYDVEAYKRWHKTFEPGEKVHVTEKIHGSNGRFIFKTGLFGASKFYVGSRNLWKAAGSTCAWRRVAKDEPWIEKWCRMNPGYALYGEVTPTQKGYDYANGKGVRFFLFDIRKPDGTWAEVSEYSNLINAGGVEQTWQDVTVPLLYDGPWDEEAIKKLVDGPSTVPGAKHIREGIVVKTVPERTVRGLGRVQLKIVSNDFLAKETR